MTSEGDLAKACELGDMTQFGNGNSVSGRERIVRCPSCPGAYNAVTQLRLREGPIRASSAEDRYKEGTLRGRSEVSSSVSQSIAVTVSDISGRKLSSAVPPAQSHQPASIPLEQEDDS